MPGPAAPMQQMSDGAFHDQVVRSLAELHIKVAMLLERVESINGGIAKVTQRVNTLEIDLTAHPLECPFREKIDELMVKIERDDRVSSNGIREQIGVVTERIRQVETRMELEQTKTKAEIATSKGWVKALAPVKAGVWEALARRQDAHLQPEDRRTFPGWGPFGHRLLR